MHDLSRIFNIILSPALICMLIAAIIFGIQLLNNAVTTLPILVIGIGCGITGVSGLGLMVWLYLPEKKEEKGP